MHRVTALIAFALAAATVNGQAYRPYHAASTGPFPAQRNHQQRFLQRPVRLPLEAILEVRVASDLLKHSVGETPAFASAPVVGQPSNPFTASVFPGAKNGAGIVFQGEAAAARAGDAGTANPFAATASPAGVEAPPFDAGPPGGDPFAEQPAGSDPADNADPFAGGDDPFAGGGDAFAL